MSQEESFEELQRRLGYVFQDPPLLKMALTHRSWANEQGSEAHYERAEFLGDAVLALLVAHWLYERHPSLAEGELSKLKSYLVSEPVLATWARDLSLGEALLLGVGEDRSGGRRKRSLLADSVEAILGAIYLDGGLEVVRQVIYQWLSSGAAAEMEQIEATDPKTALQERAQALGFELPAYRHVFDEGPDHQKLFHVECWVGSESLGEGSGASKKQAEQRAARVALKALEMSQSSKGID